MPTAALLISLIAMSAELTPLVSDLQSADPAVRQAAAESLARLGEGAQGAAVVLVKACGDPSQEVRDWATSALEGLGAPAEADLNTLAEFLQNDGSDIGYWAATLLGRLEDAAAPATAALASALDVHPAIQVRERAAWALGQIGPTARAAADELGSASKSPHARLARLAADALAKIESE